ncbi:MAG: PAS domain S-box protein [Candidatus Aminicenantes bacterium]|nr:PAS domain S-box protein [Candidatus Aminicenantes bacterium]
MEDKDKTKTQLMEELGKLRQRIAKFDELDTEGKQVEKKWLERDSSYRDLFEDSPISLWEQDFGEVIKYFDELSQSGVTDLEEYFAKNPGELFKCADLIKVKNINTESIKLFKARTKDELIKTIGSVFSEESLPVFQKSLISIAEEKESFESECILQTLEKERLVTMLKWSKLCDRVIVSIQDITKRKRTEDELRASKLMIEGIIDTVPARIFWKDKNLVYLGCNAIFARDAGFTDAEEIIGKDDYQMGWSDQAELYRADDRQVIESGSPKHLIEEQLTTPDGNTITLLMNKIPLLNSMGEVEGILGTYLDITDRIRSEESLSEEKIKAQKYLEVAGIMIVALNAEGVVTLINKKGCEILGYKQEELLGKNWFDCCLPNKDRVMVKSVFNKFMRGKIQSAEFYENQIVTKKGDQRIVAWHNTLIKDRDGKVIGTLSSGEDVTERNQAQEELKDSADRLRILFEFAPDAYYLNDLKGTFLDGNRATEKLTGYKREELIGNNLFSLKFLSPSELNKAAKLLAKNVMRKSSGPDEFMLRRKDGNMVPIEISTYPVTIENKPIVLGIARNITYRKKAEKALRLEEEKFRRSMDESPMGIRIVGGKEETLYANRAILDSYGYKDIAELRSVPVNKRYTPKSYAEYKLRKKKRMNGEDYPSEYEISIVKKTGEIRNLQVNRKQIFWDGNLRYQAIYQDITKRRIAETKLQETLGSLRTAFGGIIQVLSAIVEKRDPYTSGHQKRVADLARSIGKEMGLPREQVDGLRLGGIIHDIGKVSIPAEILSKPGLLTETEFKLVQDHPQIGYDIVRGIEFSWPIADMIHQHHERMNGSGYPQRLKGEEILLEARILAVSDVIEAMASHRPYRPALGIETALDEIKKDNGILFDPDVIEACLTLFQEKGYKLKD